MDNKLQGLFNKRIKSIVKILSEKYNPEKVILFGSIANKSIDENSDIDLLIIKRTSKNPWKRLLEVERLIERDFATDLLVYTPLEIQKRLEIKDFFIQEIIEKGRVVYERSKQKNSKRMVRKSK